MKAQKAALEGASGRSRCCGSGLRPGVLCVVCACLPRLLNVQLHERREERLYHWQDSVQNEMWALCSKIRQQTALDQAPRPL